MDQTQEIQSREQNWKEGELRGFHLSARYRILTRGSQWGNMTNQSEQSSKNETQTTRLKTQQSPSPRNLEQHGSMGGHQRRMKAKTKSSGEVCKSNVILVSGAYHTRSCPSWHSHLTSWLWVLFFVLSCPHRSHKWKYLQRARKAKTGEIWQGQHQQNWLQWCEGGGIPVKLKGAPRGDVRVRVRKKYSVEVLCSCAALAYPEQSELQRQCSLGA